MNYKKLDNNFVQWENGNIGHRPMLKIILNPILRFIQPWTNRPMVIASICTVDQSSGKLYTELHGYRIVRMCHDKS